MKEEFYNHKHEGEWIMTITDVYEEVGNNILCKFTCQCGEEFTGWYERPTTN